MFIKEVISNSFILVKDSWSVKKVHQLITRLNPTHIIIGTNDLKDLFFLFNKTEVLENLEKHFPEQSIYDIFNLSPELSSPIADSFTSVENIPDQCIILENGKILGFFDALVPPKMELERGTVSKKKEKDSIYSIIVNFPKEVIIETSTSLLLQITKEVKTGLRLPTLLTHGALVDIIVIPQKGFILEGTGQGNILITDDDEILPLQIKLKATQIGQGKLKIYAFNNGQLLGSISLNPIITSNGNEIKDSRVKIEKQIAHNLIQPDLSLIILESNNNGKPAYTFRITAKDSLLGLNFKPFGPIYLKSSPFEYFQKFFEDIEGLPSKTPIAKNKLGIFAHSYESVKQETRCLENLL